MSRRRRGQPGVAQKETSLTLAFPVDAIADAVAARLADQREQEPTPPAPDKLAMSIVEAADQLGVSADHFRRHVLPELRIVRSGRLRLVPMTELRAWLDSSAARVLAGAPLAHDSAEPHGKRASDGAQGQVPRAHVEGMA